MKGLPLFLIISISLLLLFSATLNLKTLSLGRNGAPKEDDNYLGWEGMSRWEGNFEVSAT